MKMHWYGWVTRILVIIGALNWGLAIWDMNVVASLVGAWPMVENVVYGLVGLSGLYELVLLFKK